MRPRIELDRSSEEFKQVIEISVQLVNEILQEALLLDEVVPYSVRKKEIQTIG